MKSRKPLSGDGRPAAAGSRPIAQGSAGSGPQSPDRARAGAELPGAIACAGAGPPADWAEFLRSAGLKDDELAFLTASKVQTMPHQDIAAALGWTQARLERVRKRTEYRLKQIRAKERPPVAPAEALSDDRDFPIRYDERSYEFSEDEDTAGGHAARVSAVCFFYRERLSYGGWVYALTDSDRLLYPASQTELSHSNHAESPRHAIVGGHKKQNGVKMEPLTQLTENLRAAEKVRENIAVRMAQLWNTFEDAQKALRKKSAENHEGAAMSTMRTRKQIAALETTILDAEDGLATARAELEQATAAVEQVTAELRAKRYEVLAGKIEKLKPKLFRLQRELCEGSVEVRSAARELGFSAVPQELLFDDFNPIDQLAGYDERVRRIALLNQAAELVDFLQVNYARAV